MRPRADGRERPRRRGKWRPGAKVVTTSPTASGSRDGSRRTAGVSCACTDVEVRRHGCGATIHDADQVPQGPPPPGGPADNLLATLLATTLGCHSVGVHRGDRDGSLGPTEPGVTVSSSRRKSAECLGWQLRGSSTRPSARVRAGEPETLGNQTQGADPDPLSSRIGNRTQTKQKQNKKIKSPESGRIQTPLTDVCKYARLRRNSRTGKV